MLFTIKARAWEAVPACAFRLFADGGQRSGRTSKGARASRVALGDRDSRSRWGGCFGLFCADSALSEGPSEFCLGDSPAPYTRSVTTGGSLLSSSEKAKNRQKSHVRKCMCLFVRTFVHLLMLENISYWKTKGVWVWNPCYEELRKSPPKQMGTANRWMRGNPALRLQRRAWSDAGCRGSSPRGRARRCLCSAGRELVKLLDTQSSRGNEGLFLAPELPGLCQLRSVKIQARGGLLPRRFKTFL